MKPRMNFYQAAPDTMKALMALEEQIQSTGLEKSLIELVKIRASQINGCAFCINMHTEDARKRGETEQRIYLLNAWRESPLYTDRERAALAWTESVTLISETHAPDDVYEQVRAQFSDAETVNLTMLIGAINAWNRIAIAFRAVHPVKVKARRWRRPQRRLARKSRRVGKGALAPCPRLLTPSLKEWWARFALPTLR
ncbi:AhpD family alkylhydroperoxidase [Bradyrhizobium sp. S3.14.4]